MLSDFGVSEKFASAETQMKGKTGTKMYMPPEARAAMDRVHSSLARCCPRGHPPAQKPRLLRAILWDREESPRHVDAEARLRRRVGA